MKVVTVTARRDYEGIAWTKLFSSVSNAKAFLREADGQTFSFVDSIVVDRVGVDSDENYERVLEFDVNYRYDAATDDFRGNFSRWNSSERTHEEYYI